MKNQAVSLALAGAAPPVERPRLGLRIDVLRTLQAGRIELAAVPDHRLKVHVGTPVRGACKQQRFVYTEGDVDIMPAGSAETWVEEDAGTSLLLQLSPALLQRAAQDLGLDPRRAGLHERHQCRDPQIEHIARALEAESSAGAPSGLLYAESLGMALAVHLLGRYPAPAAPRGGLSTLRLRRVRDFIEAHLDRDLTIARIADAVGLGSSHLKTQFKRATGVTVHAYVMQRRVERAKQLLMHGELSAAQVALDAGFAHQSHMARCMRRVLGVTPSALTRGHGGRA